MENNDNEYYYHNHYRDDIDIIDANYNNNKSFMPIIWLMIIMKLFFIIKGDTM